ncbi:hypothetical protein GE21DRAFT_7439 [Neurospora crassa]|uniref:Acyltransferase n=2 Tax=Neurospora crassa TaxID=5141 RepID=Q1K8D4_NEUCR|nr:acyltransferase [Neurospora crassa OR74A]EAA32390.1 acyltransferase [Neurospora crassa OR74A]KHE88372.1 hypothetical protein GE21DRAFT_7439 [Neurospora crassa]CAD70820.1 related to hard surface induced protein 3 (chip3) [Neurospora crassa]|eukprot:XP_961626.1 acyltransferase [Neurospora crassa OR74A]
MNHTYTEETSSVGLKLNTDKAFFPDIESNAGHEEQEVGRAPRRRQRRHSTVFGWLPRLNIGLFSGKARHHVPHLIASIRPLLLRSAFFLLPSFLQSRIRRRRPFRSTLPENQKKRDKERDDEEPRTLSPTAYLDGMRGIAAFSVFLCHHFYTCFFIAEGWGSGGSNYHILKLPIIRLFYSGPPMVCIFFVISGYAISLKPLKLIHSGACSSSSSSTTAHSDERNYSKLFETLSSLVFRRGLRLFLPPAISTFLIVLLLRLGAYEWNREFASDENFLRNVQEIHYERFESATEQFVDWGYAMLNFVHLWDWDAFAGSTGIDVHLWTIPVEFRASMVLFLTILGTARLNRGVRRGVVLGWCGFAFLWERWEMCLFWMGMVLAESDVIREMQAKGEKEGRVQGVFAERNGGGGGVLPVVEPVLARTADVMPQQRRHPQRHPQETMARGPDIFSDMTIIGSGDETSHESHQPPTPSPPTTAGAGRPLPAGMTLFPTVLLVFSLYLLSQPDINSHLTPGWITLTSLIPHWWTEHYRFYQSIGAVLFVYSVSRYPSSSDSPSGSSSHPRSVAGSCSSNTGPTTAVPIFSSILNPKTLFESSIARHLGKTSYAIYLVHGPVLHTFGYTVMKFTWTRVTGTETDEQYVTGFVLASLAVVPLVIWVADVFWRGVDEPVVRLARRLEERVVVGIGE